MTGPKNVTPIVPETSEQEFSRTIYGQRYLLMKRQIAAGLTTNGARRAASLSAGTIAKARPSAAKFFALIDHADHHHAQIEVPGAGDEAGMATATLAAFPRFLRSLAGTQALVQRGETPENHLEHCGWWWCQLGVERLQERFWSGLHRALETLRRAGIDPWSFEVALVGSLWEEMEHLVFERKQYEQTQERLGALLRRLDGMSDAARIVRAALAELQPLSANLSDTRSVSQKGGRQADLGSRAALKQALGFGWKPATLASVAVLVAANPNGMDDFRTFTKRIGESLRRLRK
jgi:hypothetical protein